MSQQEQEQTVAAVPVPPAPGRKVALILQVGAAAPGAALLDRGVAWAKAGHEVAVVPAPTKSGVTGLRLLETACRDRGLRLIRPDYAGAMQNVKLVAPRHQMAAYQVYAWLKNRSFDHIHFPADRGVGFFPILARRQGLAFAGTSFSVDLVRPALFALQSEQRHLDQLAVLEMDFMAQRCFELADAVACPDPEVATWTRHRGWSEPASRVPWEGGLPSGPPVGHDPQPEPYISVCVPHYNCARYLGQTIASLRAQDYARFEVILVDDGSTDQDALAVVRSLEPEFRERGWTMVRQENMFIGAARNRAAQSARGDFLLFVDHDDYAKPHDLSTYARAAACSGADILTCFNDRFTRDESPDEGTAPDRRSISLGGPVSVGLFRNCFGNAHSLFRRTAFQEVGGFDEERGVLMEDRALHARLLLRGYTMDVVPEALYWYRYRDDSTFRSLDRSSGEERLARIYEEAAGPGLRDVVGLAHGLKRAFDTSESPQEMVDKVWKRGSWQWAQPIRNVCRRLGGNPPARKPQVRHRHDALREVEAIRSSATWDLAGPFRAVSRIVRGPRRRGKST